MNMPPGGVAALGHGCDGATAGGTERCLPAGPVCLLGRALGYAGAGRLEAVAALVLGLQLTLVVMGGVLALAKPRAPAAATISGRIFAPPGVATVPATVVLACAVRDGRCDPTSPRTRSITVQAAAPSAPFKICGLAAGPYTLVALRDLNGDGIANVGDWAGTAPAPDGATLWLHVPARGVELRLKVIRDGG